MLNAVTTYKNLNVKNILPCLAQEIKMFPDAQAHSLPLNRYNKEPQGSEMFNRVGHYILKSLSACFVGSQVMRGPITLTESCHWCRPEAPLYH